MLRPFQERTPILLEEGKHLLQNAPLGKVEERVRRDSSSFYPRGSFHSAHLQREVYGGSKKVKAKISPKDYLTLSIRNILFIERHAPSLVEKLPLFMGGVVVPGEGIVDIFMEDYTRGIQAELWMPNRNPAYTIPELEPFITEGREDILPSMVAVIDGERRILDLDQCPWKQEYFRECSELAPFRERLQPYLITVDSLPFKL
ncbi:MAG: hypothetical protein OXR66_04110 [Candidatus Woesearchaeota archaeon]|nr:hypothetical protein [Candidatus Woesearchaeota archaeon]